MFMPNIPRRKIYEKMLEFEDAMIEMHIMIFNEKNFQDYISNFNESTYLKLQTAYCEIKALFIMFVENRKYESEDAFEKDLNELAKNSIRVSEMIFKEKDFSLEFKKIVEDMDKGLNECKEISSLKIGKELYKKFDKFNSIVPLMLEVRRDKMKRNRN